MEQKYYKKNGWVSYFALYILPTLIFGFVLWTMSLDEAFRNSIYSYFPRGGRYSGMEFVDPSNEHSFHNMVALIMASIVLVIVAFRLRKPQIDPELVLNNEGMFCLPQGRYPIFIEWNSISDISKYKNRIGNHILVLKTPGFKPQGARKILDEVKISLARLRGDPEEIFKEIVVYKKRHK